MPEKTKKSARQDEFVFLEEYSEQFETLFARILLREIHDDDESLHKKTRNLFNLYRESGGADGKTDHTLIALSGWCFESIMDMTIKSHKRHVEEHGEDYDPWEELTSVI